MPDDSSLGETEQFLVRSGLTRRDAIWRRHVSYWLFFLILVLVIVGAAWTIRTIGWTGPAGRVKYAWVQMLPDDPGLRGGRLARAIVAEGNHCPKIMEDGRDEDMIPRRSPMRNAFPILVCEAKLQASSDAWIGADHLPVRPENPQNIVVLGDTGCRVVYWQVQPCRSGVAWPFAAVAVQAASKIKLDDSQSIIIHVGDFHYRENPCADVNPECGGSPYGDNWATWEKEFFEPASPLLLAAPWLIMRGNHENCARAGAGWIFLFGLPGATAERACQNNLPSYSLSLGRVGDRRRVLTVLDTANAHDEYTIMETCKAFRKWIDAIDDDHAVVWLALHQPLLARSPDGRRSDTDADDGRCEQGQTTDALKAIRAMLLSSSPARHVRLFLGGDLHVFQYFQSSAPDQPVQIIAGMGGTKLDSLYQLLPKDSAAGQNPQPAGDQPQWDQDVTSFGVSGAALTIARHGFVSMHRDDQTWTVTMLDVNGDTLAACHFSELPNPSRHATAMPDCDNNPTPLVTAPSKSTSQGPLSKSTN
jgi:hypothetical protein